TKDPESTCARLFIARQALLRTCRTPGPPSDCAPPLLSRQGSPHGLAPGIARFLGRTQRPIPSRLLASVTAVAAGRESLCIPALLQDILLFLRRMGMATALRLLFDKPGRAKPCTGFEPSVPRTVSGPSCSARSLNSPDPRN